MFIFLVVAFLNASYSQEIVYSSIFKNINKDAKSLNHYLNTSGDTLFLESTFDLNKIEIIGTSGLKKYAINDSTKDLRIPLNDLPLGDYTIAVVHTEGRDDTTIYRKTIIFKVARLIPIDLGLNKRMNNLASNMSFGGGQIPILDLSENKIIKEFPKPIGLASNIKEVNGVNLDSKDLASMPIEQSIGSLSSINMDSSREENLLNEAKISRTILKQEKSLEYKPYNLSDMRHGQYVIQSREDYRRNNLRPNGRRYD
jgi:hypothetical protein